MGREYSTEFEDVSVAALQDFFELIPADDVLVCVKKVVFGQTSDPGDAAEELLVVKHVRGHATTGSGGTAGAENALQPGMPAADTLTELNNTTIATAGTPLDLLTDVFNTRVGYQWVPTPDEYHYVTQADGLYVVRLPVGPADALSMSGYIVWEEIG